MSNFEISPPTHPPVGTVTPQSSRARAADPRPRAPPPSLRARRRRSRPGPALLRPSRLSLPAGAPPARGRRPAPLRRRPALGTASLAPRSPRPALLQPPRRRAARPSFPVATASPLLRRHRLAAASSPPRELPPQVDPDPWLPPRRRPGRSTRRASASSWWVGRPHHPHPPFSSPETKSLVPQPSRQASSLGVVALRRGSRGGVIPALPRSGGVRLLLCPCRPHPEVYLECCSQGSEMADGDSSDFTFCRVSSEENDGQLGSPKAIPVASMLLEDVHGDSAKTAKKDGLKANDSDKDRSGNSASVSIQDSNMKEPITQTSGGAESNVSSQAKPSSKKPAVRKKVPFEKGYSQMDWLKLTRTHPDLAGLKGQSNRRLISLEEVKQHKTGDCIWTVLKGRVYNIAPYMKFHPGGVDMLMKAAGKDCTALFNKYHAWVNAEFLLEKCLVGFLDPNE